MPLRTSIDVLMPSDTPKPMRFTHSFNTISTRIGYDTAADSPHDRRQPRVSLRSCCLLRSGSTGISRISSRSTYDSRPRIKSKLVSFHAFQDHLSTTPGRRVDNNLTYVQINKIVVELYGCKHMGSSIPSMLSSSKTLTAE